jgi:hypothetical protein
MRRRLLFVSLLLGSISPDHLRVLFRADARLHARDEVRRDDEHGEGPRLDHMNGKLRPLP